MNRSNLFINVFRCMYKAFAPIDKLSVVITQSLRWSLEFASSKILLYFFDKFLVYKYNKNLINIVIIQTTTK